MGLISLLFFICALRTNLCFCVIFFCLVISFGLQTAGSLLSADDFLGNEHKVHQLRVVSRPPPFVPLLWRVALANAARTQAAGAMTFVACWSGWYILLASLLASVDFPISLPVGDLSTVFKGKQERSGRRIRRE